MELRCQRKESVSYGLGADFSLPHCLVGDKVSESSTEPSPAGISEPRAEISWCIVMVQRFGKVSRGTAACRLYFSLFFSHFDIEAGKSPEDIVGKEQFHSCPLSCPCQIVDGYCVQFIAFKTILYIKHVPLKIYPQGGLQPLGVQDQGPVSQEIPPRIWRNFRKNVRET